MFEHDQAGKDVFELLADVRADRLACVAALRAGTVLERDVVDDPLAGQTRWQELAAVASGGRLGGRRFGPWRHRSHWLGQSLRREQNQLTGINGLALLAVALSQELLELVLEVSDELVLLTERLGQCTDLAVGGVEVAGEDRVVGPNTSKSDNA
jgi:hypothetical protein